MKTLITGLGILGLTACTGGWPTFSADQTDVEASVVEAQPAAEPETAKSEPVVETSSAKTKTKYPYRTALAEREGRPADDYAMYEARKALGVLKFTGALPGMTIVEMEAGDGFYTELFAAVVGEDGKVYQQNPAQFDAFLGGAVEARGHIDHYGNVEYIKTPFDAMTVEDASADMVTWFLGPHELWFVPEGEEMGLFGGTETSFAEIARVLKDGGTFIALDHMAPPGAPATTGGDTHRIDKAIIIDMAEAAGLTLIDESDILANPEDDRTVNVFDPSVRRKTDRFLLKFQK